MDNDQVTYFSSIPAEECRSLLGSVEFGRVAWAADDGIMIVPVNFRMLDGRVVFHTAETTALARIGSGAAVAFQADEIDAESAIGWSVLLRGALHRAPDGIQPVSWMTDDRPIGLTIEETSLSGRVVSGMKRDQE